MHLGKAIPQLPSGNLEVTAEFMAKRLGFNIELILPEHGHLIVVRDDAEIHFWQTQSEDQAKTLGSCSSCYIRVNNIEALFTQLQALNAPFRYELTTQPWGMKEMQIDDPYGNAIRFGQPVS